MANTDPTASQQAVINDVWDETNHLLRIGNTSIDTTNNVTKVEQRFSYLGINTAATTVVKGASGFLHTITIAGGVAGAITVFDNTAGSGTTIIPAFTPGAVSVPVTITLDVAFGTGLTIVTAAATVITVSYR